MLSSEWVMLHEDSPVGVDLDAMANSQAPVFLSLISALCPVAMHPDFVSLTSLGALGALSFKTQAAVTGED